MEICYGCRWRAPKFLVRPKKGPIMLKSGSSWNLMPLQTPSTKGGWEGRAESFGIRLGRGTTIELLGPTSKPTTSWLIHLQKHFWCWDKSRATRTHLTHHGLDSGEATTFPHILFSTLFHRTCIQMAFILGTPKEESRNCLGLDSRDFGSS